MGKFDYIGALPQTPRYFKTWQVKTKTGVLEHPPRRGHRRLRLYRAGTIACSEKKYSTLGAQWLFKTS